ncbi:MAG: sugar transferase [Candidatus Marinimicrobia bacterium]|nr:sugar transferase [Candidatus Neomarinimicrobiota bacterium]
MKSRERWNVLIIGLLLLGDLASLLLALRLISSHFGQLILDPWFGAFAAGNLVALKLLGQYNPDGAISRVDETFQVVRNAAVITIALILLGTIFEITMSIGPRGLVKLGLFFSLLTVPYRWLLRSVQKMLFAYHIGTRQTVIIGTTQRGDEISRRIREQPGLGYDLVGFVDDDLPPPGSPFEPLLGDLKALPALLQKHNISEVIITLDKPEHESLLKLMSTINGAPVEIKILPDMYEVVTGLARTEHIYGLPLIRINPDFITPFQRYVKRAIDVVIALAGLLIIGPLLLAMAILVRLTSPGPAIFIQERVGYRGKRFNIHKLRTMVENAEGATGPVWAQADDPRTTPIGRVLRRLRIDELPQLWNVLLGNMSLVGPRPERPHFVDWFVGEFPYYYRRLQVRPGITGWAQVRGNYDTSLEDVRRKLKDDFFYIENFSIRLDLKILLMTIRVVLSGQGT